MCVTRMKMCEIRSERAVRRKVCVRQVSVCTAWPSAKKINQIHCELLAWTLEWTGSGRCAYVGVRQLAVRSQRIKPSQNSSALKRTPKTVFATQNGSQF